MRRLVRLLVFAMFALSMGGTVLSLARIAANPALAPIREAARDEISALVEAQVARAATPGYLADLLEARLAEEPRNWIAIDALTGLAIERAVDLPADLAARLESQRAADFGLLARAASCAICAYNAAACSLSEVFACQAPVALTPVGDLIGVVRAGTAYASGQDIDQIDLALSVVGLGATGAVLLSGGTSVPVKAGAALAKTARSMGRLSPALVDMARGAMRGGVDWAALPAVRSLDDLAATLRPAALAPLTQALSDLERLRVAVGSTGALHLLPMAGSAADARKLALAGEALGPRTIASAEVLGKARLFRATLRISGIGWSLLSSLGGVMLSVALMAGSVGQSVALRFARRL